MDFVVSEEIFGFVAGTGLGEDGFAALVVEAVWGSRRIVSLFSTVSIIVYILLKAV